MEIKSEVVTDSFSWNDHRITSFLITAPRYILAEFNTHRMLTRSSASSRAIPFAKMMDSVLLHPFVPSKFPRKHSGMSATEYITKEEHPEEYDWCVLHWLQARSHAVNEAEIMHRKGVSKQITNRLMEPAMWHTILVTATDLENFFALRADPPAEPSMQELAYAMLKSYNESTPVMLKPGEWHVPFNAQIPDTFEGPDGITVLGSESMTRIKIATAIAARTSYTTPDSKIKVDLFADVALHDRLAKQGHWSAFEHCARTMTKTEYETLVMNVPVFDEAGEMIDYKTIKGVCGNFRGYIQYRKFFPNENRSDGRVVKRTPHI